MKWLRKKEKEERKEKKIRRLKEKSKEKKRNRTRGGKLEEVAKRESDRKKERLRE